MAVSNLALFGAALFGLCAFSPGSALSASLSDALPVPEITIYPGDAIKDDWLIDREFSLTSSARGGFVSNRETIVGKIARRTLLPGAPIPLNAVSTAKIVANGARVRMVFEEGALTIAAYGAALQDGGVGDVISLRNLDTGLTVSGTIQADGSVRLSGG
ncbi:MAG: flagellar basal body P-ring formation chaperone FlgA [Methylocella sp.]